jgi:hypothetical protein
MNQILFDHLFGFSVLDNGNYNPRLTIEIAENKTKCLKQTCTSISSIRNNALVKVIIYYASELCYNIFELLKQLSLHYEHFQYQKRMKSQITPAPSLAPQSSTFK